MISDPRTLANQLTPPIRAAVRTTAISGVTSIVLAIAKITAGLLGNSYALVADGIESLTDVVSSVAVLLGLAYSIKPPDEEHPYGHGKLETLASLFVALAILLAATLIVIHSLKEIAIPQHVPKWFTLPVLVIAAVVKVIISRNLHNAGKAHGSASLSAESWHQFSDAITSVAAFVGISIALAGGGDRWASADDWATLIACAVIYFNGFMLAGRAVNDLLDKAPTPEFALALRTLSSQVPSVLGVEKMRVRRSGLGYLMDIHIEVDPHLTVYQGHEIAGAVKSALLGSGHQITDVTVHVEPFPGISTREISSQ